MPIDSTTNQKFLIRAILFAMFCAVGLPGYATSRNLIPRLPELVLERGYSDSFQVMECEAQTNILDETAESSLRVVLKNISESKIQSSLKIRILYLTSETGVQLEVDGKPFKYDRNNPRVSFTLEPNQEIAIFLKAKHDIQYSLEAMNRPSESPTLSEKPESKKRGFVLNDLTALFDNEKLVKRLMVGALVSKWGIFPIDFKHVKITVALPPEFDAILPDPELWKVSSSRRGKTFIFEGTENFAGALFLPKEDAEQLRKQIQTRGQAGIASRSTIAP